ncbi:MAG: 2-oxoglutarate and iron-dependent oxygenase domain-containing protein [Parasphingorhabdus sp.]|nr:2-oxoglutarate and iron-dependent oxygenase domain-containing protein [Parasphingorhabdus sp.]
MATISRMIPSVSLAQDPAQLAKQLGAAFAEYGFAIIRDHGIDDALIARAETFSRELFALPEDVKRAGHVPGGGGARGYTPFGIEKAKDASVRDLKEFWHIGRDLPPGHRFGDVMPPNIWPAQLPQFRAAFTELFAAFDAAGGRVLSAIARYLGLSPDFFTDTVADGNSVLRLIHYPPTQGLGEGVRAAAHEDINTITLLLGAQEAGLELLDRDGSWLPVAPGPGELVVNIGDMLQRLTNHRLPSTSHRVVNPPAERAGVARYSMPFFLHFRPDYLIKTLPQCIDAAHPDRYPEPILAQDYLTQRLREIGLI